ncbi:SPOR domain-containing protein [Sedimenticola hydrogenitrophicus]|uniref:SPOR domain-containing protein n=1 Tax=Sedimenticola hydrogenitrophicus TaxID=2967975 RepID=UPI0021A6EA0A|nr:SPOR domain-containing protein [Sedimenticola hydrogenitrophicus]
MPRDYKSRATPQKKGRKQPLSGWVWFASGLLVGLFVTLLVWLKLTPDGPVLPKPAVVDRSYKAPRETLAEREPEPPKAQSAPKPRFDFYTILPEMEVVVPDPEPEVEKASVAATPANGAAPVVSAGPRSAAASAYYMLQMGSFRKFTDADKLKASLALVGIEAEIQKFTLDGGEVFHRVRSGPYTSGQVNTLRARLSQNNINSLVIKLKK